MAPAQRKPIRSWFRLKLRTMLIVFTVLIVGIGLLSRQYATCQREAAVVEKLRTSGATVTSVPKSNSFLDQRLCGTIALPAYHVELKYDGIAAQLELLRQLAHVHKLKATPQTEDLSELAFLTELRSLDIYCWYTKTLKGIEGLQKLEILSLSDSDTIRNLEPLKGMKNLKTIHTSWEDAGDLFVSSDVVASLINLQHFEVAGCELESVSAFSHLIHLETINIDYSYEPITGLEKLVNVPSLREIGLPNVSTLENLDRFPLMQNLEKLCLFNASSLKNIDGIANLKKLKVLILLGCHPDLDRSPLTRLKTLTRKRVQ